MLAEAGDPPRAWIERPRVADHLLFVGAAFQVLSGDRQLGFGAVGPYSYLAIDRSAERFGIVCVDEFENFHALIRAMDGEFCKPKEAESKPEQ